MLLLVAVIVNVSFKRFLLLHNVVITAATMDIIGSLLLLWLPLFVCLVGRLVCLSLAFVLCACLLA